MTLKKSSRKCVALPKLLFYLLNLKREPRKISVDLENTPRVLSLFYFSKWSFGNHNLTLSVKFTTWKNTLWKFHLFCLHHTQLSVGELSNKWEVQFLPWFLCQYRARSLTLWKMARWLRNSLMRDKKTELEIFLSYRFRMVLITGCPLLNVKKREIPDFLLKRAQTVRSFCAIHGVKTKLPTKLLIRCFLPSIGKNTFLFFFRLLSKSDPWKSSRQSINLYRPYQKKLTVIWR